MKQPITRRTVLRGVATAIALPWLEGMLPGPFGPRAARAASERRPVRLVYLYTQSGMWMDAYTPKQVGADWELTETLQPLAKLKSEVSILTGLRHANAFKHNPVANRHTQDQVCHLTAADLGRVPGIAAKNSISVDQLAARHVGHQTRLPTLNLRVDEGGAICYNDNGSAVPELSRPDLIFDRLFGDGSQESRAQMAARFRRQKSVLDDVLAQTARLNQQLGAGDRQKLEEYLTRVREVEQRLEIEKVWAAKPPVTPPEGAKRLDSTPPRRSDHGRSLVDLLVLALQTDQTRIATLQVGSMGCQYPELGAPDGYHGYTHGAVNNLEARKKMIAVDRARIGHLAYFLERLQQIPEGEHDLLYHSFVHYASGMGSTHGEGEPGGENVPNLIAGRAGGALQPGRHLVYENQPLSDLYVRMLQTAGAPVEQLVDSTGPLENL